MTHCMKSKETDSKRVLSSQCNKDKTSIWL